MARAIVSPKAAPERPADPFQKMPTAQARNSGRATPSRRSVLVPLTGRLLRRRVAGFYSAVDTPDFITHYRPLSHGGGMRRRLPEWSGVVAPQQRGGSVEGRWFFGLHPQFDGAWQFGATPTT